MKTIKIYSYGIDINTLEIDIASWDASLLDNNIENLEAIFNDDGYEVVYAESTISIEVAKQKVYDKCLSLSNQFNFAAQEIASHDSI